MAEQNQDNSIDWTASEFIDHQRGASWYLMLIITTAVLAAVIFLITRDFFTVVTIAILGIIVGAAGHWKPRQVNYRLTDKGLHIDEKFYPYSQFKFFSIIHENELSSLVMANTKRYLPPLTAFIDAEAETAIVELVGDHLPLQAAAPDRVDRLSRYLRL